GIKPQTLRFLDVFLLHCLLADSPPDTPQEIAEIGRNQHRTAAYGRQPGLQLERNRREIGLQQWAEELLAAFEPAGAALDAVQDQKDTESRDSMPFEIYRQQYISPERLGLGKAAVAPALAAV